MVAKLLAVDDDATSAELIVRIAERCGFEAFATSDPRGFLELCKQLNPSVVSIDINMPNIDANGLLKLLMEVNFQGKTMIVSGQDFDTLRSVASFGESLGLARPEIIQKPIDVANMRLLLGGFWRETQSSRMG
jgi:two-component system, chemotaxis family, chemotaxis protein CheY